MNRILVAHGTRKSSGVTLIGDLAGRVAGALGAPVEVAFVDVLGPTPAEVLQSMSDRPAVLVPAFLARGYHVRSDIPAHVEAGGHPDVTVAEALGPDPQLVRVLADRLSESGWRSGDSVILGAAGTSDPGAMRDLHLTATWLSAVTGDRVDLAFAATGSPRIHEAVAAARRQTAGRGRRVVVASYLLSEGLFQDRLRDSGADIVTEPLGTHGGLVRLIVNRFRRARLPVAA